MAYIYKGIRQRHTARRWTAEEDRLALKMISEGISFRGVGKILGRSKESMASRSHYTWKLNMRESDFWSPLEEEKAKALLTRGLSYGDVANSLGRSQTAVLKKNFREWHIVNTRPREQYRKPTRRSRYGRRYHDNKRYDGNRVNCLIRDEFRCQDCGVQDFGDTILNVHHLDGSGKSQTPHNDLSNLLTLCVRCHSIRHNRREVKCG
jgi:5-methylcytosine-specific restriction endonuclease McrA